RVENLRMILHRLCEIVSRLDIRRDIPNGCSEFLVLLRIGENLKTLYEWHAGIDHDRKLPRKNRQVLWRGIAAEFHLETRARLLFLGIHEQDLVAPQCERECLPALGSTLAGNRLAPTILSLKSKDWHKFTLPVGHCTKGTSQVEQEMFPT